MTKRVAFTRGLYGASVALALVVGACGPSYPDCATDENCRDHGEYCVDKLCKQCRDDSHCNASDPCRICDTGFVCSRRPGCCVSDTDCPGGRCWKEAGQQLGQCGPWCRSNADCPEGQICENGRCTSVAGPTPSTCQPDPIYFDFNESKIREDQKAALQRGADCLKERNAKARLEGNCDERGTEEYNLALGSRRANAVRNYVKTLGVADGNVSTISYGKEKPTCNESNEECWWRCRRTDFNFNF